MYHETLQGQSALVAEAAALEKALWLAAQQQWSTLEIWTNSSILVQSIQSNSIPLVDILLLIDQCLNSRDSFLYCIIRKTSRRNVKNAHRLPF